jgi:protein TonB
MGPFFGVLLAVVVHLAFLLFGGLIFGIDNDKQPAPPDVLLVSDEVKQDKEQEKVVDPQVNVDPEEAPDAAEALSNLEPPPQQNDAPALDAASLGAIEAALNGAGGPAGEFGGQLSFASGGRIGGTGKGGPAGDMADNAFSLAEIDQQPRPVFQSAPQFPAEMRGKKIEGVVVVTFLVDATGKVGGIRIEKSSHPAFEKPAVNAVRQWKFEPAVKGGQRVSCKLRQQLRFQPN